MVFRNRILIFIYRLCATLVGIFTLIAAFNLDAVETASWNSIRYLGTEITLYATIILLIETILSIKGLRKSNKSGVPATFGQVLFMSVGLEMALAIGHPFYFLFINIGNSNLVYFSQERLLIQLLMYIVFPLVVFLDWLFFSEKGNWKWHWLIYFGSVPVYYAGFSFLNHYIRTSTTFGTLIFDYRTFVNQGIMGQLGGWAGVIIASLSMFALYLGVATLLLFFSFLLSGKYARKNSPSSSEL